MVECGRGCQLPFHSTVGRMHGEPCDTECNACKPMLHDFIVVPFKEGTYSGMFIASRRFF